MNKQKGYINLDGLFGFAVFGLVCFILFLIIGVPWAVHWFFTNFAIVAL